MLDGFLDRIFVRLTAPNSGQSRPERINNIPSTSELIVFKILDEQNLFGVFRLPVNQVSEWAVDSIWAPSSEYVPGWIESHDRLNPTGGIISMWSYFGIAFADLNSYGTPQASPIRAPYIPPKILFFIQSLSSRSFIPSTARKSSRTSEMVRYPNHLRGLPHIGQEHFFGYWEMIPSLFALSSHQLTTK